MKIQGLNNSDLEVIDRALRYVMGEQALRLRQEAQGGEIKKAEQFLASFTETFATYKKFTKEWGKYADN